MIKLIRPAFYHNKRNASYCALSDDQIPDYIKDGDEVYLIDEGIYTYYNASTGELVPDESGGSSDYNDLENKPSINSVTLVGNKTGTELGLDEVYIGTTAPTDPNIKVWFDISNNNVVGFAIVGLAQI